MIDTKELRRLTQAATPGPWVNYGRQPSAAGLPHSAVAAKTLLARVYSEAYGDVEQETANASFIAAANPAAITELLDRLEAAEKGRDAMRAKVEAMENQEPVFWWRPCSDGAYEGPIHNSSIERVRKQSGAWSPLYLAPGAQPVPSVPDLLESLRCACNYIDKLGGVSQQYRAMLAAAPEAKP